MPRKLEKRICPACGKEKLMRSDCKTCGCRKGPNNTATKLAESIITTKNTWEVNLPSTTIHTLEQLIEKFEVDLSVWEVERFVANKWEVVMKPPAFTEMITTTKAVASKDRIKTVQNTIPMWQRHEG